MTRGRRGRSTRGDPTRLFAHLLRRRFCGEVPIALSEPVGLTLYVVASREPMPPQKGRQKGEANPGSEPKIPLKRPVFMLSITAKSLTSNTYVRIILL